MYIVKVTTKEKGPLGVSNEHEMRGEAWETWDDAPWTIVQVGAPLLVEADPEEGIEEHHDTTTVEAGKATVRVQVPTETVQSISVAVAAEVN